MTKITADWLLSENAQRIMRIFADAGHQIYFVGGCVRNALLGEGATDIDMSTSARPDEMLALAKVAGIKCVPTGIDHGTLTWVVGKDAFEITTFRKDIETDGRRAVVAFSDRVEDDANRRDFTMNALYCDSNGEVIDPVGGLPDLVARRVLFIGKPEERIAEDYLRVLRFFRFHAWYGDDAKGLDAEGLAACAAAVGSLGTLSRERVGAEIMKLLSASAPETALGAMEQSGVLTALLSGAGTKTLFTLSALDAPVDPLTRLAALCDGDAVSTLRLPKRVEAEVARRRDHIGSEATLDEIAYRHGAETAIAVGYLRAATFETHPAPNMVETLSAAAAQVFPLKAADLMHLASGPALGKALRDAEDHWIKHGFTPDKEALVTFIEQGGKDG
ncbi:CCA tRNA nucleotidyltransferase [Celeribacter sp.]|uniref:CCA tRNA nucleotidyltransferase n=1 Tax=Celeribacter sp. TaxID=1890673 RepID=UPI003A8E3622